MKEITKTITKKYNSDGKLIEHTEVIVEKEIENNFYIPSIPSIPSTPNYPWQSPTLYHTSCKP